MATSTSGNYVEFDCKFLERSAQTFRVYVFEGKKTVALLHDNDAVGAWRTAKIGDMIRIRIPYGLADSNGLMGDFGIRPKK